MCKYTLYRGRQSILVVFCVAERAHSVELVKQGTEDLCGILHTGETAVLIVAMVDVAVSITTDLPTIKER